MSLALLDIPSFKETLQHHALKIKRHTTKIVQVNIGYRCNQICSHCHVTAGPDRTENMEKKTVDRLLELLANAPQVETVDITGGAPELNPHFRYLVTKARAMGKQVINRTNLTVFFEPDQQDTPQFLADNKVQIYASLPCYTEKNVDQQRGTGTFKKSIKALQILNNLGYGKKTSGLMLNLVYNPLEAYLPAPQAQLESDYKTQLKQEFGIEFNQLLTIINMPIGRFARCLEKQHKLQEYMALLASNFNAKIVNNVMCTDMISIGWDGKIYDCDFNQMLQIPITNKATLWDIKQLSELSNNITIDNHCYGCTAGTGSSCQGALK